MPSYTINNTAGATVATIGVATTTGPTFPIELVGQGISLYGPIIATTQYHLLENFTNTTSPTNPVTGMLWYNPTADAISYYDGSQFVPLSSPANNSSALLTMLPTATAIDLTATATTPIFIDPNVGDTYHITGLLLKVNGAVGATGFGLVNLLVTASEDVMENVNVMLPDATKHGYYVVQGTTAVITAGATLNLEVSSPATGGALLVDAYVFGFKS